jgi:hypothetical protein
MQITPPEIGKRMGIGYETGNRARKFWGMKNVNLPPTWGILYMLN